MEWLVREAAELHAQGDDTDTEEARRAAADMAVLNANPLASALTECYEAGGSDDWVSYASIKETLESETDFDTKGVNSRHWLPAIRLLSHKATPKPKKSDGKITKGVTHLRRTLEHSDQS